MSEQRQLAQLQLLQQLLNNTKCDNIWLQPISTNKTATNLCIEQATINHWKISIQTHKFIGVR